MMLVVPVQEAVQRNRSRDKVGKESDSEIWPDTKRMQIWCRTVGTWRFLLTAGLIKKCSPS